MRLRRLIYKRLHIWRLRHIAEGNYLICLSVVVGILSGLSAVVLKTAVHLMSSMVMGLGGSATQWLTLVSPAIGIVLTVLLVKYVIKKPIGHGIPNVLFAIARNNSRLPSRNMYASLLASTLTVAFGGSVGLEAPIASTGSAIGSNVGRLCRLQTKYVKLLLGCGAAGAIAGIFKAPLAGILFVVEVYMFDLSKTTAVPLLLSSISATTVAYFLMGNDVQFAFTVYEAFELNQIPLYIALGVFCALSSIYFLRITDRVESWFAGVGSLWKRVAVGGVALGVMIFLFPPLYGEGYGTLTELLNGNSSILYALNPLNPLSRVDLMRGIDPSIISLLLLILLILLKGVATATTIGSGGVGGTFGPSLIVGGLSGFFVASLCNTIGLPIQSTANFALVGMAAVMAGVMHAPLMATFLIAEITGGYALMPPLLISVAVTYVCVNPFEKHSIYARKLAKKGNLLTHDKDQSAWQLLEMRKLLETSFVSVRKGNTVRQLIAAIECSHRNIFPVLDDDSKFVGIIYLDDVRRLIFQPEVYDLYYVEELVHPLTEDDIVNIEDPLSTVVDKFRLSSDRYNIVVVDGEGNYQGLLSRANTFSAYRRFVSQSSDE